MGRRARAVSERRDGGEDENVARREKPALARKETTPPSVGALRGLFQTLSDERRPPRGASDESPPRGTDGDAERAETP